MKLKSLITTGILLGLCANSFAETPNRWKIEQDGAIKWEINDRIPHFDHVEMAGQKLAVVLYYGVDANGAFQLNRSLVFPMLRMKPNKTQSNLKQRINTDIPGMVTINELTMTDEKVKDIRFDGVMTVESSFSTIHRRKKIDNAVSLITYNVSVAKFSILLRGIHFYQQYGATYHDAHPGMESKIYNSGRSRCLRLLQNRGIAV